MKRLFLLVAMFGLLAIPVIGTGGTLDPVPADWSLSQNDPDPFCYSTRIQFGAAQDAHVQFAVWSAGETTVVRLLIDGMLPAGVHAIVWDGRDDQGANVPNGEYPYRIVAQIGGATVYDASLVLQIQCNVAADERTWGALKSLYRP